MLTIEWDEVLAKHRSRNAPRRVEVGAVRVVSWGALATVPHGDHGDEILNQPTTSPVKGKVLTPPTVSRWVGETRWETTGDPDLDGR